MQARLSKGRCLNGRPPRFVAGQSQVKQRLRPYPLALGVSSLAGRRASAALNRLKVWLT